MTATTLKDLPNGISATKFNRTWWLRADSVAALNELSAKPHPLNAKLRERLADAPRPFHGGDWDGVPTLGEARAILDRGAWEDGVERVMSSMEKMQLNARPHNIKRKQRWTDQGDELDLHRVYNGQLDTAWRRCMKRSVVATRNITLLVNITINASTPTSSLFWRGAAALLACDILTEAGYHVEVEAMDLGFEAFQNRDNVVISTRVKEAQQPLDLNSLAVSLCLAAFLRRVSFCAECAIPETLSTGLGCAANYRDLLPATVDDRDVILLEDVFNQHQAERWVKLLVADLDSKSTEI